jgi:hypothetical protein
MHLITNYIIKANEQIVILRLFLSSADNESNNRQEYERSNKKKDHS